MYIIMSWKSIYIWDIQNESFHRGVPLYTCMYTSLSPLPSPDGRVCGHGSPGAARPASRLPGARPGGDGLAAVVRHRGGAGLCGAQWTSTGNGTNDTTRICVTYCLFRPPLQPYSVELYPPALILPGSLPIATEVAKRLKVCVCVCSSSLWDGAVCIIIIYLDTI